MKLKDAPIQRKLMSIILLTCLVVLLLMGTAYLLLEYFSYRQVVKTNVSMLGTVIASNSSASLAFDSPKDANEILNALKAEKNIVVACLYDNAGKIFAKYPADTSSEIFPVVQNQNNYWFHDTYLMGFQPVLQKDKRLGTLYIQSDLEAMYAQLRYYSLIGFLLIAGSLLVAYILSKLLQKAISEPIVALEQTAKIISEQRDYSVRAIKRGNDEVGAFTDAFNQMLTQIHSQNSEILSFNQKLEQKVNERTNELQERNLFIETLFDTLEDNVAVFDINSNYVALNKKGEESYNVSEKDVIGKNVLEVFPDVNNSGMYEKLQRAIKGETIHDISYYSPVLKSYLENFYIPLKNIDGEVYNVLLVGHDNTEVIEAAERIRLVNIELEEKNEALLKSNRDLEQFAYVASHDLQEPLRKIQTFSHLLEENFNDEEKLKNYHKKISQAASRMQNLIQDVLNFSRISKSEEAFVQTNLNLVLENLKTDFELLVREKNAVINHPVLPVIKGIPMQLSQLFSNIISNALKYNDKNPVIDISFRTLSHEETKKYPTLNGSSYVQIQFADNGIGFEPQFSEQIFAIFQRLHGRQAYSGTGIGLALCKKIVENHHGLIYAEGEPDIGAKFTVILPV